MIIEPSFSDTSTESVKGSTRNDGTEEMDLRNMNPDPFTGSTKSAHGKRHPQPKPKMKKHEPGAPVQSIKKTVSSASDGRSNSTQRVARASSTGRAAQRTPKSCSSHNNNNNNNNKKGSSSMSCHESRRPFSPGKKKMTLRNNSRSPMRTRTATVTASSPGPPVRNRTSSQSPSRRRKANTSQHNTVPSESLLVPQSPNGRLSAKFVMSANLSPKRPRQSLDNVITPSSVGRRDRMQVPLSPMSAKKNELQLSSPLRWSQRLAASPKKTLPVLFPLEHLKSEGGGGGGGQENDDEDDEQNEFAFDFAGMYTNSPSKRPTINHACDRSVDDSFIGPRQGPSDDSFWDLQNSSHDKPDSKREEDEPFGPVVKSNSTHAKQATSHDAFRRPGLFRSLSSLMSRGGGGRKSKESSAASTAGDLTTDGTSSQQSSIGMRTNVKGKPARVVPSTTPKLLGGDNSEDGEHDDHADRKMRHAPSRSSSLTFRRKQQQAKNANRVGRHNSSASLPEIPMTVQQLEHDSNILRSERNCVVLDIQRKPTGELDEITAGYRVVHLITDLIEMTVWDAVREAHRSYPDNRIFKVDTSLEEALRNGSKRAMLVVGGCNVTEERIEIRQSFDYWKTKNFNLTLEALLPLDKQRLSIQVEYADVLKAVDGEKDMFDRF